MKYVKKTNTSVITGLTNAAVQGVAKGAGLIQEVSCAGITAGLWASPLGAELTETLKGIANASSIDAKMVGDAIMQSGKMAVAANSLWLSYVFTCYIAYL